MAIPTAVQRQADAAMAKMQQSNTSSQTAEPGQQPNNPVTPMKADEFDSFDAPKPINQQDLDRSKPKPAVEDEPKTPAHNDDWEHKFKVLQGKYNTEVPRLNQQLRDLQQQHETLKAKINAQPAQKPVSTDDFATMREDYGEEFVKPFEALVAQNASLVSQVEALQNQLQGLQGTQEKTAQDVFFDRLDAAVPNWEQVNADQGFHAWLREFDPIAGLTRQESLNEAEKQLNANRVIAIFSAYAKGKQQSQQNKETRRQDAIEQQLAPATNKAEPQTEGKPVYALSDVKRWYEKAALTQLSSKKPQEYERLDREFTQAQAEGRIDQTR